MYYRYKLSIYKKRILQGCCMGVKNISFFIMQGCCMGVCMGVPFFNT